MGMPVVIVSSGGLAVTEVASGFGLPVSITANGYGIAITIVASGGLPVVGSGASSGPSTPVLALISVVGSAVSFSIDVDDTVVVGDTVRLQTQVAGGSWSSPVTDTTHTITSGEDTANRIDLTPSGFANGNYEARAMVHHVTDSAWSNTVAFTVSAAATPTYYLLGF